MRKMIPWKEAMALLADLPVTPRVETVPLEAALGRVLAEDVCAAFPMPPFPKSPFDGFALDAAHAPGTLPVSQVIPAGARERPVLTEGTAARIFTGAPVPLGANVVVRQEDTSYDSHHVTLPTPLTPHTNILGVGEDYPAGAKLAAKGHKLTPAQLGLLASQGLAAVAVYRRPRAAILSTGSELFAPGTDRAPCGIYNSSYYTLRGYLEAMGFSVAPPRLVPDELETIAGEIQAALDSEADLVLTTGGASVGDYDFALESTRRLGARVLFWKVGMKPGAALLVSQVGDKGLIGLSGNPAAALMSVLTVLQPYLRHLTGQSWQPEKMELPLLNPMPKTAPVTRALRGHLRLVEGKAYFEENDGRGNGNLRSFGGCSMIALIPPDSGPLEAGQPVTVLPLPEDLRF